MANTNNKEIQQEKDSTADNTQNTPEPIQVNETNETTLVDDTKQTERLDIAKDIFAKNTEVTELHFTSDLIPFFSRSDANSHASKLDDKLIVTINKQ